MAKPVTNSSTQAGNSQQPSDAQDVASDANSHLSPPPPASVRPEDLEALYKSFLEESNVASLEPVTTHDNAKDKMLNYCIRMLHSEGWIPQTVIRAMVIKELNPDESMRRTMWRAFLERKAEIRAEREARGRA